jgi:hypothetical protein
MSLIMPRHLLRASGCLLAGISLLAVTTDGSLARHRHHSGQSGTVTTGAVASDAKKPSKTTDFTKGNEDAPARGHFHLQAPGTGTKRNAVAAEPLDLSVTVHQGRWSKKMSKPAGVKKTVSANPSGNFHKHKETFAPAKFGPVRNAVGVSVGNGASSTHAGAASGIDLTAKGSLTGTSVSHQGSAAWPGHSVTSHQGFSAVTTGAAGANNASVSGNVVRPGSAPGSVGGIAKNMAGINGTTMRPKRCLGGC